MAVVPTSTPFPPSSTPGIFRCDAPPTNLRYWDGKDWSGGPIAALGPRIWGNAIDVFLAFWVFSTLFLIFSLPFPASSDSNSSSGSAGNTIALFVALLIGFAGYFAVSYRLLGRTVGMLLAGTYLIHVPSGATRLPWGPSIVRSLVLSAGYICGFLWLIWLLVTSLSKTQQGPHDRAANTAVLTSRKKAAASQRPAPVPPPAVATSQSPDPGTHPLASEPAPALPPASEIPEQPSLAPQAVASVVPPQEGADSAPLKGNAKDPDVRIFISHASQDDGVAVGLASALEAQGLQTWLASRDVSIGGNYAAEIFQNLVNSDYLLVVLSSSSIESAHVRREVSIAIDRKVPVLPVSTDSSGELMANLPEDWQYWLNIAQVFRMTDKDSTAVEIARRVK